MVADGHEEAVGVDVTGNAVQRRLHAHAGHAGVVAQHFLHLVVPDGLDLAGSNLGKQLVLHDLFRLQGVAAVDQIDLAGDVGQVKGLFHGGVATADHDHVRSR